MNLVCVKVRPDPSALAVRFGGYALGDPGPGGSGTTRVIFSNGLLDPWSGGGFLGPPPKEKTTQTRLRSSPLPTGEKKTAPSEPAGEALVGGQKTKGRRAGSGARISADALADVHWVVMPKGAHHSDLRGLHPEDPPDVAEARRYEERIIKRWIDDIADAGV